ncbi:tRNA uridine-5-carboxymethylaminomethyl(34) synthesis GTPase MnmE [Sphingorhabdus sp.]|uniref:tRNA uridine-5-carboxymethylaminomethyl(34) synthesis GTPase MnmE n=1 Tax=Sphingorhabdus sp. TaxID=1902408 RepID=UPI00391A6331
MPTADTIFALSSGAPPAAIAIVRVSGAAAFDVVRGLAGRVPAARRASLCVLRSPENKELLDQALVLVFPGPDSATGEDLAELHLHGGRAVVRAVEIVINAFEGVRQAEAGEFTRRAFANGRMDLNEAEGLADLLSAETEWQRRSASLMFGGAFSTAIETFRQEVLHLSALTEAELDFSDEGDVETQNDKAIKSSCQSLLHRIERIISSPPAEKLKDGLRVVLGGPPNSGKSTLLNALVDRDAAIVSDIAGTTRDMIEVPVGVEGIALLFTDTAGLRDDSADVIERIGIDRSHAAMRQADIVLWLGPTGAGPDHPNLIEVATKSDVDVDPKPGAEIAVSGITGDGVAELRHLVAEKAKTLLPPPDEFAVNARQRLFLTATAAALAACRESDDWLIIAENLRLSRRALDDLTGRAHTEELLDNIFGKFCVGK